MNYDSDFTKLYPVSKTLRFRLEPVGKTLEHIKKSGIVESDKKKKEYYFQAKTFIDNYYKDTLSKVLSKYKAEEGLYEKLAEAIVEFRGDKSKGLSKVYDYQKKCREHLVAFMMKDEELKKLAKPNSEKIIEHIKNSLSDELNKAGCEEIQKAYGILSEFKGFAGYFDGYFQTRANLFDKASKDTAIANRVVDENFPLFLNNIIVFEYISDHLPDLFTEITYQISMIRDDFDSDSMFEIANYSRYVTQDGINRYNGFISGFTTGNGEEKTQGINEIINLYCQKHPELKRNQLLFKPLRKQILFDRTSESFVPFAYENEDDLVRDIPMIMEKASMLKSAKDALANISGIDYSKVYISSRSIHELSIFCYGRWNTIDLALDEFKRNSLTNKNLTLKKIDKEMEQFQKQDFFQFSDIISAYDSCKGYTCINRPELYLTSFLPGLYDQMETDMLKLKALMDSGCRSFKDNDDRLPALKGFLDSLLAFVNRVNDLFPEETYLCDENLYASLDYMKDARIEVSKAYDKIRNFMTKKNQEEQKFKLNFNSSTLANGWSISKEYDYRCFILRKDGQQYLGIHADKALLEKTDDDNLDCYEKMLYRHIPNTARMLPKVMFPKSENYKSITPPGSVLRAITRKRDSVPEYFKPDYPDVHSFEVALIDFYQRAIPLYSKDDISWADFNMTFKNPCEYLSLDEFYEDVDRQSYFITFEKVSAESVNLLVDKGSIYLFKITNKDYASGSNGRKNLHTIYWNGLFSDANIANKMIKLNGQAELFFRPAGKDASLPETHPVGSWVVNRFTKKNEPLPDAIHRELYEFANGRLAKLSNEAEEYRNDAVFKKVIHGLSKGKRFREDQFFFHVPLTFNPDSKWKAEKFNDFVISSLQTSPCNVIGIDRGERNLIYVSVVSPEGEILYQSSLNAVETPRGPVDYQVKLKAAENDRKIARQSWSQIGRIKDLKEGYLSNAVSLVARLAIEYNAIVCLENLNYGFKRGRFKIERQIYQKFEAALIKKLNLLVFKNKKQDEPGGVLNPYQLTDQLTSFERVGYQTGCLFYVPAAYTSKIDPVTGFADIFTRIGMTNYEKKCAFLAKMKSVSYDKACDSFVFRLNTENFDCSVKLNESKEWAIYTRGKRLVYSPEKKQSVASYPTEIMKNALSAAGILYSSGDDILKLIVSLPKENGGLKLVDAVFRAFSQTLQMRNSNADEDYIISPVMSENGTFYDSREYSSTDNLPCDADANGAYNIARKGLLAIQRLESMSAEKAFKMDAKDWFSFVMR